jgi:hypothetical protein
MTCAINTTPLREHHALPPSAGTADEVLAIGRASVIASDDRERDDAIVATIALIQEPATPRGRQSQFETGLVPLAIRASAWCGGSAHHAMRRLCGRSDDPQPTFSATEFVEFLSSIHAVVMLRFAIEGKQE